MSVVRALQTLVAWVACWIAGVIYGLMILAAALAFWFIALAIVAELVGF